MSNFKCGSGGILTIMYTSDEITKERIYMCVLNFERNIFYDI